MYLRMMQWWYLCLLQFPLQHFDALGLQLRIQFVLLVANFLAVVTHVAEQLRPIDVVVVVAKSEAEAAIHVRTGEVAVREELLLQQHQTALVVVVLLTEELLHQLVADFVLFRELKAFNG